MRIRDCATVAALLAVPGVSACEVQQERPAEFPEVEVQEGQLPEYEVETGAVEVERDTVVVPEVEVERDTVSVPEVEVEEPDGRR